MLCKAFFAQYYTYCSLCFLCILSYASCSMHNVLSLSIHFILGILFYAYALCIFYQAFHSMLFVLCILVNKYNHKNCLLSIFLSALSSKSCSLHLLLSTLAYASSPIGPSAVRALPLAAGINVGGHSTWNYFSLFSLSKVLT